MQIIGSKERTSFHYRLFASSTLFALMTLRNLVMFGRILDKIFFTAYMREEIRAPICIIAAPRSGTTFLHRLMCLDPQFTNLRLYHSIFPAVSLIKFVDALARIDAHFGRSLSRIVDMVERNGFDMWSDIHPTQLKEPEEDEQLFLFTLLSPSLLMFFPFPEDLSHVAFVDSLASEVRQNLSLYYRDSLMRMIYASGSGKTLLTKNVLIHGRLRSILGVLPDMRVIHLVRHPYETIPSFISMYTRFWKKHSLNLHQDAGLAHILCDYYRLFHELKQEIPKERMVEIPYDVLLRDPEEVVSEIYEKFNIPMTSEFRNRLQAEVAIARSYKSIHSYSLEDFGLTRKFIYENLKDVFEVYGFER